MQQISTQQIHFVNAIIFDNAAHVRAVEGEAGAITVNNFLAHIDAEKCTNCGVCAEKCPRKIIKMY